MAIYRKKIDFGGVKDNDDERDYPFEAFIGAGDLVIPNEYDVEEKYGKLPVKNQKSTQACGAYAITYYAMMLNLIETGEVVDLSPRWYYPWTRLNGGGSFTRDNVLRLVETGATPESYFPSNPITEEHLSSKSGFTDELAQLAETYQGRVATVLSKGATFDEYRVAIFKGHGVVSGYNLSSQGYWADPVRPPKSGEKTTGHIIYMKGYGTDQHGDYISYKESSQRGEVRLRRDYFEKGFVHSAWTVIDIPNKEEAMVTKDNANGILFALDGKTSHAHYSESLANALNNGNQDRVNEIIDRYKTSRVGALIDRITVALIEYNK